MDSLLLTLLLAPFLLAPFLPALSAKLGAKVGWVALLAPVTSFFAAFQLWRLPDAERAVALTFEWAPQLGANLSFLPDGLGLLYALIVSGVGVCVVFYAACYLDDHHYRDHGKFYCYLLLFMGAMFATVLSSNLMVLFVAWELTGLTSFLLIGFLHEKHESQRGARMALLTTGITGLALLVGVVLLRVVYGTYEITEILASAPRAGTEGLLTAAFLCCFIGIAGKSAQFPFHYWLPNAMAAPTPVSAYLHSATMVKLGVFLTARMLPIFNDLELWTPVLTTVGFGTLLLGAVFALLSQDLKGVLAYTTVAQLGLLIGYYGLHAQGYAVKWDALHILNHVFYKACLFMVVGIIDHSTGTRDLRKLGGLAKKMPLTAIAAALGLAALAGLPPTTGFLSKEMLLKTLTTFWKTTDGGAIAVYVMGCVLLASLLKVAIALRVWRKAFGGAPTEAVEAHYHGPSVGLQLPPLLLASAALGCGLFAPAFGRFTETFSVVGVQAASFGELHLWHGFTLELGLSALVVAAGLALYFVVGERRWGAAKIPDVLRLDARFDPLVESVPYAGKALNKRLGFENPYSFVFIVGAAAVTLFFVVLLPHLAQLGVLAREWALLPAAGNGWWRWGVVVIAGGAGVAAAMWKQPIRQVCALSVMGLGVTVFFVVYAAPDLALTQLLVETATLLLVLLVVLRLKRNDADRQPLPPHPFWAKPLRVMLSVAFGLMLGAGVLIFQHSPTPQFERAGDFYIEQTVPLAKGSNAVNTILVDFRGFDTLLEIAVLVIAALGCLGLLYRAHSGRPFYDGLSRGHSDFHPVPRDLILRYVAIWGFIPLNLFAGYLFLRGHQAPGGGFIAGLVTSLSLILLVFVLGVHGVRRLVRFNPLSVAAGGVVLSIVVAFIPVALGMPLFYHYHGYVLGFYIGTPFWFDLGVYLAVVGVLLKLLLPLMKSIHGLPAFVLEEAGRFAERDSEPIDLVPPAESDSGKKEGAQ
jgi:multicomponent K+:H+ antiporter subunit A/multicomponent Na+:H+ antiporter subunit A